MSVCLAVLVCAACQVPRMQVTPAIPACRAAPSSETVRWVAPDDAVERRMLVSWCDTVGPAAFNRRQAPPPAGATLLVTWNVHAGGGDIPRLIAELRAQEAAAGRPEPHLILLLQEAIRIGAAPARVPHGSPMPDRIGSQRAPLADIIEIARREDLHAVYVPSMRNGSEGSNGRSGTPEDRGNAILSTLPLSDVLAIELPLSAQRRVAVSALVGAAVPVRVVSLHLDTSGGQASQAEAVLEALAAAGAGAPVLVGGDFNSSMRRRAVISGGGLEVRRVPCAGITHSLFQLDHVLATDPGQVTGCARLDRFGSDHAPLMVRLR